MLDAGFSSIQHAVKFCALSFMDPAPDLSSSRENSLVFFPLVFFPI